MRMLVGAVAVVAALATGGVPAVLLSAGQGDDAAAGTAQAGASAQHSEPGRDSGPARGPAKPPDKNADGKPGYGPPTHAMSSHNVSKPQDGDRREGPGDRGSSKKVGPQNEHAARMSALGRAHGKAMSVWGACVEGHPDHESETFDPQVACGEKPIPPGHLKKATQPGQTKPGRAGR